MNLLKNKTIAIVGGGPGGLTLARLLQMKGATVKVYERDRNKDARMQGATLDLHEESGLKALQEAGLMDAFRANYRPGADKLRLVDRHANILFDDDANAANGGTNAAHANAANANPAGDRSRPEIDRGPLQNILLDSLQPGTIVWNSHFINLSPQPASSPHQNSCKLDFKDTPSAFADIVIAADGANSKLRPYITPIRPFYAGVTAVEGAVYHSETATPGIHQLLNGGKIFALDEEKTLIVGSKGDGSLVFYTSCQTEEQWAQNSGIDFTSKAQVTAWFKTQFAGWDNIWMELFDNASSAFVPRPQYCMPLDQTWEAQPNLTMLGDAAHLMPPFAGEGVNMAMLDALELAQCLSSENFSDTRQAIAAYEHQMRTRASATAKDTLDATAVLHSPNAIKYFIALLTPPSNIAPCPTHTSWPF
jgi:2-polyprenyl-6-methoxyphenol hydroxylase-like FAD-dependent oxidoreductase